MDETAKDDEIEVDVTEGAPADAATDPGPEDWKAQYEAAQKKYEEAEAKREAAEKARNAELDRHTREQAQVKQTAVGAEMIAIDNAIANVEHARAEAKRVIIEAMNEGDFAKMAEAQDYLMQTAVKEQRLREGKNAVERRAEEAKQPPDPVEQWVANMTPQSAQWCRAHEHYIKSADGRDKLVKAHHLAVGNGHLVDSSGYFDFIEKQMAPSSPDVVKTTPRSSEERDPVPPVAPPSRDVGAASATSSTTRVRLTAAEREIAMMCGMSDAEYAKEKLAAQKDQTRH